jgi:16S rRNA (cytosine1402-N4)-methyltransferase
MTRTHVPVLAGELIDLLDPRPGETAVDCTFGAGGHARLVAERIGPAGTLICIDRDPAAADRFDEFAAEVPCETRFLRAEFATGLRMLRDEGLQADLAYLDLGVSSMQLDAWERGFSYSYDAPLDMRMDPDQSLDARQVVNEWDERRLANAFRTYGDERERSSGAAASRRWKQRPSWSMQFVPLFRHPCNVSSAVATRRSGSSRRSGLSSTTSSARSTRRCRLRGTCCARPAALA